MQAKLNFDAQRQKDCEKESQINSFSGYELYDWNFQMNQAFHKIFMG